MAEIRLHAPTDPVVRLRTGQSPDLKVRGDFSMPSIPDYEGPYTVAPSGTAQTLATDGKAMTGDVTVEAAPLQAASASYNPTESAGTVAMEPDEGFYGLSSATVAVSAIPSDYVGSAVARRDGTDLAASGATVTAPSGYYAASASKAVQTGSVAMKKPSLDKASGEVRSQATATEGYITGGSLYGSALILDKQAGTTIVPSESQQTAVPQYRWTTGDVIVAAIPYADGDLMEYGS